MGVHAHHERIVVLLKQMPHPLMATVEPLRVQPLQLTLPARQRRLQRHHEQMEMIPHQTIRKHPPAIANRHRLQDLEKPLPIPIIPKHQRAFVTTL